MLLLCSGVRVSHVAWTSTSFHFTIHRAQPKLQAWTPLTGQELNSLVRPQTGETLVLCRLDTPALPHKHPAAPSEVKAYANTLASADAAYTRLALRPARPSRKWAGVIAPGTHASVHRCCAANPAGPARCAGAAPQVRVGAHRVLFSRPPLQALGSWLTKDRRSAGAHGLSQNTVQQALVVVVLARAPGVQRVADEAQHALHVYMHTCVHTHD